MVLCPCLTGCAYFSFLLAACTTVQHLALAQFPLHFQISVEGGTVSLLQYWVQFIRESLGHVDEDVKLAGVTASEAVAENYLAATVEGKGLFSRELLAPLTKLLEARGTQCHKRVGAARALGSTPAKLAEHYIDEVCLLSYLVLPSKLTSLTALQWQKALPPHL